MQSEIGGSLVFVISVFSIFVAISVILVTISSQAQQASIVRPDEVMSLQLVESKPLKAMNDNTNIKGDIYGNMFILRGSIDSVNVYKLLIDNNDYVETVTIPADCTRITPIKDEQLPRVETRQEKVKIWGIYPVTRTGYNVMIPESSIESSYTLDLK